MACAITASYTIDCPQGIGGLAEAYIIEHANVTAITISSDDIVTAITKASGKTFKEIQLVLNTSEASSPGAISRENGSTIYKPKISILINKLQKASSQLIESINKNLIMAVVVDRNGSAWLYGYENGLMATSTEAGSGKSGGDRNGYMITLEGEEARLPLSISSSVISTLTT